MARPNAGAGHRSNRIAHLARHQHLTGTTHPSVDEGLNPGRIARRVVHERTLAWQAPTVRRGDRFRPKMPRGFPQLASWARFGTLDRSVKRLGLALAQAPCAAAGSIDGRSRLAAPQATPARSVAPRRPARPKAVRAPRLVGLPGAPRTDPTARASAFAPPRLHRPNVHPVAPGPGNSLDHRRPAVDNPPNDSVRSDARTRLPSHDTDCGSEGSRIAQARRARHRVPCSA